MRSLHQHARLTAQVTTVIASVSLIGCLAVVAWLKWWYVPPIVTQTTPASSTATPVNQTLKTVAPAELAANYRADVVRIIGEFDFSDSGQAEQLSYQVIALSVPAELLQFQLQLVVALNEAQQGQSAAAQQRVQQLRDQYAWFVTP